MTWQVVKIIAIVSMTLDHAATAFLTQPFLIDRLGMGMVASARILGIMHILGRIAFPLYAFGMAQGCTYTKSRKKFLQRLLIFALLSEVPFQLALRGSQELEYFSVYNVLFTLLFGALCCFIWDFFRKKSKVWAAILPIAALILLAEVFDMDYGGFGVFSIFVLYVLPKKSWKLLALAALVTWLYGLPAVMSMLAGGSYFDSVLKWLCALSAVGILAPYSGQEGRHNKLSQYFFYAYYPLHLLLFYGLSQWIGPIEINWDDVMP